jgi:hypothetical protein
VEKLPSWAVHARLDLVVINILPVNLLMNYAPGNGRCTPPFAEENACGQQAIWRHVYDLMKCNSSACHLGPYCWLVPVGKKHHRLRTQTLKRLVTYAKKGGVLETHKDVPDEIKDELYMEEQQRQEKDKRKTGNILGGTPYPPINVNVLPSHSAGLDATASDAIADPISSKETCPLKIPSFREVAVKEYGEWFVSTVSDDTLKAP